MKFGQLLHQSAEEVPELQQLYRVYKQLKKRLKRLPERGQLQREADRVAQGGRPDVDVAQLREDERDFVQTLDQDVVEFNNLFVDKEEDSVIRLASLQEEAQQTQRTAQLEQVYRRFVSFHGELLLLVHWSILAYTGLVKILKKHHKRTGMLINAPNLENLLAQPFCSVEVLTNLIGVAEAAVNDLTQRLAVRGAEAASLSTSPSTSQRQRSVEQLLQVTRSSVEGIAAGGGAGSGGTLQGLQCAAAGLASTSEEGSGEGSGAADSGACSSLAATLPEGADGTAAAAAAPSTQQSRGTKRPRGLQCGSSSAAQQPSKVARQEASPAPRPERQDSVVSPVTLAAQPLTAAAPRTGPFPAATAGAHAESTAVLAPCAASLPAPAAQTAARPPQLPQATAPDTLSPSAATALPSSVPSAAAAAAAAAAPAPTSVTATAGAATARRLAAAEHPGAALLAATTPRAAELEADAMLHSIMRQTKAALGLWEQLHETASTPSTVLPPVSRPLGQCASSDQSHVQ